MEKYLFILSILFLCGCSENKKPIDDNTEQTKNLKKDSIVVSKEIPKLKPAVVEKSISEKEKSLFQQAYDLWYHDKPIEALKALRNFIKTYPKSSLADDAQRNIGTCYRNMNEFNKAISEYQKVRDKYLHSNEAAISLYDIAYTYFFELNDFPKAKYYYEQFLQEATETDKEWYIIAKNQLDNWSKETDMFEGYADRKKQYDVKKNESEFEKSENQTKTFTEPCDEEASRSILDNMTELTTKIDKINRTYFISHSLWGSMSYSDKKRLITAVADAHACLEKKAYKIKFIDDLTKDLIAQADPYLGIKVIE